MIKANAEIQFQTVRLIAADNEQLGVMSKADAQDIADEEGLDLILTVEKAEPPVCIIADLNKFKYQKQKKAKEQKKKQAEAKRDMKEIRLRPVTETHDLQIKAKRATEFLAKNDRVKITMRFRGREIVNKDQGRKTFNELVALLGEVTFIRKPSFDGKQLIAIIES